MGHCIDVLKKSSKASPRDPADPHSLCVEVASLMAASVGEKADPRSCSAAHPPAGEDLQQS